METQTQQWIARAMTRINTQIEKVWDALINPDMIKQYMFGADVVSDWKEGSQIIWRGEWEGKSFEDHGMITKMVPRKILEYKHYSESSGLPEKEENYHTVTIELKNEDPGVLVTLTQDNNGSSEEKEKSEKNWTMMLESMKRLLEKQN